MLKITLPPVELFDEQKQEFTWTKEYEIQLEHSLVSLSKWESKWCKPFLVKGDKSKEETIDYIRCMTISQNIDPDVYNYLKQNTIDKITEYIDAPMTATNIKKGKSVVNREIITSELIYYWMIAFQIDWEAQRWHLNRLLTLISVCSIKNQPKKKRKLKEILAEQKALNEQRKAKYNTSG